MMLILQNISYIHPNKDLLFDNINLTVNTNEKIALIGNNGAGKSTLLKLIAGELLLSTGQINTSTEPYIVPQIFGQYNHLTIAQALQVEDKLYALNEILNGNASEKNFEVLGDDWTIEDRCIDALRFWQLGDLNLLQRIGSLSGGQQTKVFLAGIAVHRPDVILLDEPSNHLDAAGRQLLYDFISSAPGTFLVVSHDRKLLNILPKVCELGKHGITVYGGNFDFYYEQKQLENNALNQDIQSKERALRKARKKERETLERHQKLDVRGKGKQEKAGVSRIMMNTMRNNAENSTAKLKGIHTEKIDGISQDLQELRSALPDMDKMRFGFDHSSLHKGKVLFSAEDINYSYVNTLLWKENLNFSISSGERIVLKGLNGSGKTTLIKIILATLTPSIGIVYHAEIKLIYIDQDYSLIDHSLTVYDQAQQFNLGALQEHEIKIRLNRFLFTKDDWNKPCSALSGGERMRLMLCCLTINKRSPDIIVLDEPTNNLDIQSIKILTAAINEYQGTLIVVSHDEHFLKQTKMETTIQLS